MEHHVKFGLVSVSSADIPRRLEMHVGPLASLGDIILAS